MIQPTRTRLLLLREKSVSVSASVEILRTKRLALMREFLSASVPFLTSREAIRKAYQRAMEELSITLAAEGRDVVAALASASKKEPAVSVVERSIWGLRYMDVQSYESARKELHERGYDYRAFTPHLEECFALFEQVVDDVIENAAYESKLKRLSEEIIRTTRRMRVLEERVMPAIKAEARSIAQCLQEREREAYYRMKMAKLRRGRGRSGG